MNTIKVLPLAQISPQTNRLKILMMLNDSNDQVSLVLTTVRLLNCKQLLIRKDDIYPTGTFSETKELMTTLFIFNCKEFTFVQLVRLVV